MRRSLALAAALISTSLALPVSGATLKCAADAVLVGDTCVDKYEASVWQVPTKKTSLISKIKKGKVTLADLTAEGAVQLGCTGTGEPYDHGVFPANFPVDGNWKPVVGSVPPSPGVYAVSIAGVLPSACITQLQAAQACALSQKHLIRNDEWQRAASGTPDPGYADDGVTTCVTYSAGPANTGSRSDCQSSWGANDMVGNVWEWAADWTDRATGGTDWTTAGIGGGDVSYFGGAADIETAHLPGAPIRGGAWLDGTIAGVLAVSTGRNPINASLYIGFRCAR
jgi:formylglycine-generating enzyme required for sulfatase activity